MQKKIEGIIKNFKTFERPNDNFLKFLGSKVPWLPLSFSAVNLVAPTNDVIKLNLPKNMKVKGSKEVRIKKIK